MLDKTSKIILGAIAIGVFLNAAILLLVALSLSEVQSRLAFAEQWLIRGAPITITD